MSTTSNTTTQQLFTSMFFTTDDVTTGPSTVTMTSHVTSTKSAVADWSAEYLARLSLQFVKFAYMPLATFGVLGNLLSLWVWKAETAYNCTVLMLMVLAVWDCVYCAMFLVYYIPGLISPQASFLPYLQRLAIILVLISQVGSINMTLLSSVTRLVAMFRPATFNLLLSRPRAIALCAAILIWSLLLTSPETSWIICVMAEGSCDEVFRVVDFYRENYVFDYLAYCLPSIVLFLCNIITVWKVHQQRSSSMASKPPASSSSSSSSSANQKRRDNTRRLSITMVTISMTSLLSYPVAISTRLALNPGQTANQVCDLKCFYVVTYVVAVLSLINSSVNVIYYCVISSRFTELLRLRVQRMCARVRCGRV